MNVTAIPDLRLLGGANTRSTFMRVLVGLGVILASAFAATRPNALFLAVPVSCLGVALLISRPQIGFLLLIIGSLIVPGGLSTGTESRIHAGMIMLIVLLAFWVVNGLIRRTLTVKDHPTTVPLIVFLVVAVLAFFAGQLTWFPRVEHASLFSQLGGLGLFFLSAGAFWLTAFRIRDVRWLQNMVWLFLVIGAVWVVSQLIPSLGERLIPLFERNSSGATGSLFWVWLLALAFGQAALNTSLKVRWRVVLGILVILALLVSVVLTRDWVSGWLPAVIGIAVIVWLGFPRYRTLMLVVGGAILMTKVASTISEYVLTKDNDYSLLTRTAAWGTLWELIRHNPLLGFGPANYYFYTPLFNILGYTNLRFNSHNNYVDLVAQVGFIGLVAFGWFAWRAGKYAFDVQTRVPEGFPKAFVISALAGWIGTLVAGMLGDWFLPFVYNLGFAGFRSSILTWLFLGGVIALDRLTAHASVLSVPAFPEVKG